jgi:hypothetical protein
MYVKDAKKLGIKVRKSWTTERIKKEIEAHKGD